MTKHIIAYQGLVGVSLGQMQEAYVPIFVPWMNWRIGIDGTLQRPPYSLDMGRAWVRGFDTTKGVSEVFAVLLQQKKGAHRYVGHMGIHKIDFVNGFASTGSIIGPNFQGHGVGTEAKLLLLNHAFRVLGMRKVTSTVKAWNAQSLGHLLKCGYQICGRFKKHHLHDGAHVDEFILEVFREDWEPIWAEYQKTKKLPKLSREDKERLARKTKS